MPSKSHPTDYSLLISTLNQLSTEQKNSIEITDQSVSQYVQS